MTRICLVSEASGISWDSSISEISRICGISRINGIRWI